MIEVKGLSKNFDDIQAVDDITAVIQEGSVFGLVGTNGAGKSTFLRMLCGVLKPAAGTVLIDGEDIYENEAAKKKIFYISDDQYYFANGTPYDMKKYYAKVYENFDSDLFFVLMTKFGLDGGRKINTFSKGMKKQLAVILGVCAKTKYLLCDETFDGLDPVMRQAVKSIFIAEMADRGMTPIIASHNLRELEDICDHVGLLHKGGILLSKDLEEMKLSLHKLQCVFKEEIDKDKFIEAAEPIKVEQRGSLYTMTVRGERDTLENTLATVDTVFSEIIPLSLEEIFISETEVVGYDIKNLIL
ncbi:MAG TPA: ABC transporter ATP-binding protein [Lachnospiraceae bacterium]|jgi:ABC-2 type transport system ATP-binding protein|nr:ABC transporter ATP-binding protein [Lachnospiraceae bacterium]